MRCLIWFREDLRCNDNNALYHAARSAKQGLIAVYIISKQAWRTHDLSPARIDFMLRSLHSLSENLASLNIPLLIRHTASDREIPQLLIKTMTEFDVQALYYNQQYEIDEARRDLKVEKLCKQNQIQVFSYTDQVILAPGEVLTAKNDYYTVFTPFKNAWIKCFAQQVMHVLPKPKKQLKLEIISDSLPDKIDGFNSTQLAPELWPTGESYALARLENFTSEKIRNYAQQRDFPSLDGTSQLSPYLANGIISPRQCLQAALEANQYQLATGNTGIVTWINELIWREFYKHILHAFPRISMHRAFKLATEKIPWDNNHKNFSAWCEGKTGYPLVDAAMRQLKQIGWMHNRLRMITAMFLVKDLLIDWRLGEKYFMQNLIDGDLSANNGGWQWAASTGTDAVPYFRIFNPITQSEKFDPEGIFIRRYCPELESLDNKTIHNPPLELRKKLNYPAMIVDHAKARIRTLQAFKKI